MAFHTKMQNGPRNYAKQNCIKMIQKIKDLMKTKELIDDINSNVKAHSDNVSSMKTEIDGLKNQINELKSSHDAFFKNFEENNVEIKDMKEDLRKEIHEFSLLKSQLQQKLIDKFEEELKNELKVCSESLKSEIGAYNEIKEKMNSMLMKINNLSGEISKFIEISRNIKKEDFELTKFSKQLLENDKEKLELMRKIDTLERLIAKMRRNR